MFCSLSLPPGTQRTVKLTGLFGFFFFPLFCRDLIYPLSKPGTLKTLNSYLKSRLVIQNLSHL